MSILIRQNDSQGDYPNIVILTLAEKSTLTNPTYLFRLTNEFSTKVVLFTAPDVSANPTRYNEFVWQAIKSNQTEDPHNGKMKLNPTGWWTYEVGECNVTSPTNIDWNNVVSVVELGKVLVENHESNLSTTFSADDTQTIYFTP
jgi:hypothetical protein